MPEYFRNIRNPQLREFIQGLFNVTTGHSHNGTDSRLVTAGAPAAGSVTLASLATEVSQPLPSNGTPVNAVAATGTLNITGVVLDGETVEIGADTYEFAADAALTVGAGNIAVDITAVTTAAAGTLTVDTQPTAGDDMTIGLKLYTFVPVGTANADGEIDIGANLGEAQTNIVAAINGADGHNTAHDGVTAGAFAGDDSVITALIGGVAGDAIATTGNFTAITNIFDDVTLGTTTAGVDCTLGDGAAALVAEITASGTEPVSAAAVGGDVTVTADVMGTLANAIDTVATMANGAFVAATLLGGINGTVGAQWEVLVNATRIYVCIDTNTIADANWRRIPVAMETF
jgi:hypothetical protein